MRTRDAGSLSPHRSVLVCAAGLAFLLAAAGCGKKPAGPSAAEEAMKTPAVVVSAAIQKTVPLYTTFTATIDASEDVEVRARVEAYLKSQTFQEGTVVKKGQTLFLLDSGQYEADLQTARAALAKAEADYAYAMENSAVLQARANLEQGKAQLAKADMDVARYKPLAAKQAVPQQNYDDALAAQSAAKAQVAALEAALGSATVNQRVSVQQAQAAIQSAKAQIKIAELNLGYCNITAPITGLIGRRQVAPGNLVGRGEATLLDTISALHPLRVTFSLSETEYLWLTKKAQEASQSGTPPPIELILADGSVFAHPGRVIIGDREVDPKTGTLALVAEFPNPDHQLRPGMFGRVRVPYDQAVNAVLVPTRAISELQDAKVVYVVGPDRKVSLRTVVLGDRVDNLLVVQSGLKAGETVVVEGLLKVKPGMTVNPTLQPVTEEKGGN